jgi:dienelactone hydrolase
MRRKSFWSCFALCCALAGNLACDGQGALSLLPDGGLARLGTDGGGSANSSGKDDAGTTGGAATDGGTKLPATCETGATATLPVTPGETMLGLTLDVAGTTRHYGLHVPAGYDATKCRPLVVFLHGTAFTSVDPRPQDVERHYALYGRWQATANAHGFLAALPVGTLDTQGGYYGWRGTNDRAFVRALVEMLVEKAGVDRRRVYLTGFSAGGNFVVDALQFDSNRYAAFGASGSGLQDRFVNPPRHGGAYVYVGEKDEYGWVTEATALRDALKGAGWTEGNDLVFNLKSGATHEYDWTTNEAQWTLFSRYSVP